MKLRWLSLAVFLAVIIFGVWRYRVHSEANAAHAQMKVRVLAEVKRQIGPPGVEHSSPQFQNFTAALDSQKQLADQANDAAQQDAALCREVQIALTFLVVLFAGIVVVMISMGKPVDAWTKTLSAGSLTTILTFWFYVPKS